MLAGHLGAALVLARAERRVNLGYFVLAAAFLDLAVGVFVLLGLEDIGIPPGMTGLHQALYYFPYSHGLLAAALWSLLAGLAAYVTLDERFRARAALLLGAATLSHWLLDALVHRPEMPLAGEGWIEVGLNLWSHMPWALALEGLLVLAGLLLFLPGSGLSRARKTGLCVLGAAFFAATVFDMTSLPPMTEITLAGTFPVMVLLLSVASGLLARAPAAPGESFRSRP